MAHKFSDLDEFEKKRIAELIIERRTSLFLGSGVSKDSLGNNGNMELASELRSRLINFKDLPLSASLQRAYSFLDQDEVESNLTDWFICKSAGPTVSLIADTPWRRVYTLNIDNCLETAFLNVAKRRCFSESDLEIRNFCDPFSELSASTRCSIVHLHGFVERPEDGYIFSVNEYARSLTSPNSWMLTLCQQIRTDMFIFAGTTLDEIDVEFYLEQRSQSGSRADLPRSILIEPYPTKITEKICEDHDFTLFVGTIEDLLNDLVHVDGRLSNPWLPPPEDGLTDIGISDAERLRFSNSFEAIPREQINSVNPARFLLGAQLTWDMIAANADMAREIYTDVRRQVIQTLSSKASRLFLMLDLPGSGKTSFLKRLAYDFSRGSYRVFWYSGLGLELEPQQCAQIFDKMPGEVLVFVDNFADALNSVSLILERTSKKDILFVCTERDYRLGYIEGAFSGEDYMEVSGKLALTRSEALRLKEYHFSVGLSTIESISERRYLREAISRPIVEVNCRIQNSFKQIDRIASDLSAECSPEERNAYLTVALARFCFSNGVRRSAASDVSGADAIEFLLSDSAPLALKYSDLGKNFLIPRNPLIGDRILTEVKRTDSRLLLKAFSDLAISIAPRVNAAAIKRRTPEAQLLGRLMDYDNNVKRFIDEYAEEYYERLKRQCGWNARYWEQVALLKLDRFLASPEDYFLLEESIQHARSAISAELHPFSLATLSKVMFKAMERNPTRRDPMFEEAWRNVIEADEREQRWPSRGASVFVICFTGVAKYLEMGGSLSGSQLDRLRDMIASSYSLKIRDRHLISKREALQQMID